MARRLPPLYPLRTFEAAARHLNFTRAAEELSLSQAAVSQQVKSLEEYLQIPLFIRRGRRLELTIDGQSLLPIARQAFDDIARALETLPAATRGSRVSVALAPHFAAAWLTPRLARFMESYPDIELRLIQRIQDVDFAREGVDLSVRFGWEQDWPEHETERFLDAPLTPVCSPGLMTAPNALRSPSDLSRFVLLDVPRYNLWKQWTDASRGTDASGGTGASAAELNPRSGTIIDDYNVLLRAAVDGQGVALGIKGLIDEYLDSGRLVQPFDTYVETELAYFLVYPQKALRRTEVRAFYDWLRETASSE